MKNFAFAFSMLCFCLMSQLSSDAQLIRRGSCSNCYRTTNNVSNTVVHQAQAITPIAYQSPVVIQQASSPAPVSVAQQMPAVVLEPPVEIVHQTTPIVVSADTPTPCCDVCGNQLCKCELELNTAQYQNEQQAKELVGSEKLNVKLKCENACCEDGRTSDLEHYNTQTSLLRKNFKDQKEDLEQDIDDQKAIVLEAKEKAATFFWLFLAFAILAGLLLLSLLWLISRLAKSQAQVSQLSSDLARINPELQAALANLSNAERNLQECRSQRDCFYHEAQTYKMNNSSLNERVTNGHHHHGCCDRNGTFIYNPHHPHREGESPIAQNPIAQNPIAQDPVAQNPIAQEPVAQNPIAQDPVAQNPIAQNPIAQDPVAQDPVAQNPIAQNPIAQNPIAQNPVAQNPIAQNPVAQNPIAQNPIAQTDGDQDNNNEQKQLPE